MIGKEVLEALEFNKLLDIISGFSNSGISAEAVLNIAPFDNREDIEKRFSQVSEIRRMSQDGAPLRLLSFEDITGFIEKLRPEAAVLDSRELSAFIPVLQIISDVSYQIKDSSFYALNELAGRLTGFPELLSGLERSVDSEGDILESASGELAHIRKKIRGLEARVRKRLEEITSDKNIMPFLQDDFVTKRAGRWVIPVRMDSKGMIAGVAHDVSHSGETAFIEPLEIIVLSNELENLLADEKAEEIRILRKICGEIRMQADSILTQFMTIVYLDMLNSIAGFAEALKMEIPQITGPLGVRLAEARHPLLILLQKQKGRDRIVPLNLDLDRDNSIMVITGPNAGGKTVAIKTAGLLLLMALSGIPVPANPSSVFPVIDTLLVDIGDEQSIENSLSTFSAHISNISDILKEADSKTFVLMDELGTGTEPGQGAAIGCAVLNELREKGSLVIATTHLTDVVGFVHRTEGMINASMEFDQRNLSPLYKLITGEPGQSHAIETARKYGLPEKTIEFARHLMGTAHEELHNLLSDLKEKRNMHEHALADIKKQEAELKEAESLLRQRLAEAGEKAGELLKKAYEEAKDIILDTKRQMNALMEEMKREKSRAAIKKLEKAYNEVAKKASEFSKQEVISIDSLKEGDTVFSQSIGYDVEVIRIDRKQGRLRVRAGDMYMEIPASDISVKQGRLPAVKTAAGKMQPEEDVVKYELNLIGLRVDDALSRLEPFLNHASLAGLSDVVIIHGTGTGALQRAVRGHLKDHPLVKNFRQGSQPEGGNGVTIATMK